MTDSDADIASPLLLPTEPPAFEIINPDGCSSAVLICDHGSNRVPEQLNSLGLAAHQLDGHIAWDLGADKVARQLSIQLDAPLVMTGYSRLVIDCNRAPHSKESIAVQSGGVLIPGNQRLTLEQKTLRGDTLFKPYHRAIDTLLDARAQRPTVLLSIHSFTPRLNGEQRPWHIGVAYERDNRLAKLMIGALSECGDIIIGDNEPYAIEDHIDYTLPAHGEGRGLTHLMFEIRQDMIPTDADAATWATTLTQAYRQIEARALLIYNE